MYKKFYTTNISQSYSYNQICDPAIYMTSIKLNIQIVRSDFPHVRVQTFGNDSLCDPICICELTFLTLLFL